VHKIRMGVLKIILVGILATSCMPFLEKLIPQRPTQRQTASPTYTPMPTATLEGPSLPPLPAEYIKAFEEYQRSCNTPLNCVQWLKKYGLHFDSDAEVNRYLKIKDKIPVQRMVPIPSPAESLHNKEVACGGAATLVASGVVDDGYKINLMAMASGKNFAHIIYVFQDLTGLWGYVNLGSDHVYQEPKYQSIKELFSEFSAEAIKRWGKNFVNFGFYTEKDLPPDWMTNPLGITFTSVTQTGP
jgi:hypothetical protein